MSDEEWGIDDDSSRQRHSNGCIRSFEIVIFCLAAQALLIMTKLVVCDSMTMMSHSDWLHTATLWVPVIPTMTVPVLPWVVHPTKVASCTIGYIRLSSREETGDPEARQKGGIYYSSS